MDIFKEYIVEKKKEPIDTLISVGIVFAAFAVTYILMLFMLLNMQLLAGVGLLLIAGCWFLAVKLIRNRNVEYEYILTNHELDIDKIMARSARKRLLTVDFRRIERCASVKDPEFENQAGKKIKNYAGDISGERVYFVDIYEEAEPVRVVFQPSSAILEAIKQINPRQVSVRDEDI